MTVCARTQWVRVLLGIGGLGGALAPGPAVAAGFYVGEHGARAMGTAGATTARADDPSAVFYNPAAIASLDGLRLSLGGGVLMPSVGYTAEGETPVSSQDDLFFAPHAFLTFQPAERYGIGIGVTAPFGLGVRWPDGAPGRFIANHQALRTLYVSPVVAADVSSYVPGLSLGAGLDLVVAEAYLSRDVAIGAAEGAVSLGGTGFGIGFRLGAVYNPTWLPDLWIGASGWTPVSLDLRGLVDFDAPPEARPALPPDGRASARLTLPPSVTLGLAYDIGSWLTIKVDGSWFGWSVFREIELALPDGSTSHVVYGWHDTFTVRGGLVFSFWRLLVRGGYAFDLSPVPADKLGPGLPDADRHLVSAGLGVRLPFDIDVDAAGLMVIPTSRQSTSQFFDATYSLSAWVGQVTVSIAFGTAPEPAAPDEETTGDDPTEEAPAEEAQEGGPAEEGAVADEDAGEAAGGSPEPSAPPQDPEDGADGAP